MSSWTRRLVILILLAPLPAAAQATLDTPEQRAVYAWGVLEAKQLKALLFTPQELEVFQQGMRDTFSGKLKLSLDAQVQQELQLLQASRRKAAISAETAASEKFVKQAAAEKDATQTESGVVYKELHAGLGEQPTVVDTVTVHYQGALRDGTVFDSSVDRGRPATFALNRVIPCWTEAIPMMKVGGKAKVTCPAQTAYSDRGQGALIKPGAALTFEVELIAIEKP